MMCFHFLLPVQALRCRCTKLGKKEKKPRCERATMTQTFKVMACQTSQCTQSGLVHTHTHSSTHTLIHANKHQQINTGHAVLATARGHHASWWCACIWLQAPAYLSWVKRRENRAFNSPTARCSAWNRVTSMVTREMLVHGHELLNTKAWLL